MRTFETTAIVAADHTISLKLPDDVPEGACQIVLIFENAAAQTPPEAVTSKWQMITVDPWPEEFTASREQIYGDDGR